RRPRTRRATPSRARPPAPAFGHESECEEHHADADRGVGDVERGPVPGAIVDVHEIDDRAEAPAVDQVAHGAAEDQAERAVVDDDVTARRSPRTAPPHLTARLAARRRSPRTAGHHGEAALAELGVVAARADLLAPGPAALALPAPRLVHADDEARDLLALVADSGLRLRRLLLHLRDDEERGQERALGTEERGQVLGRVHQDDARLEPAPDEPTRARGLERLRDLAAYLEEATPL